MNCQRQDCIAFAAAPSRYCTVHQHSDGPDRGTWVPPFAWLQPQLDIAIDRDAEGVPVRLRIGVSRTAGG